MIPRNPFFIRQTERIETVSSFLTLFNPKIVNFVTHDDIEKTVIFRSSAGGGKSTLFRLFSPNVLTALVHDYNNTNYQECYSFLKDIEAIKNNQVKLLGIYIPCARNYSIIDDIYENGRRLQVFFALLNLRIITATLRNILELTNSNLNALNKISFKKIPEELAGQIKHDWTGKEIYDWAVEEENKLCTSIDELEDRPFSPFAHNILSSLYLIEASNILYEGRKIVNRTLLMFDDVHKLTANQRKEILECIFQIRPNIGVWIAERCSALDQSVLLGTDGKIGREYEEKRIEDYQQSNTASFHSSLIDIANRRIRINHGETIGSFLSCIDEDFDLDNKVICNTLETILNSYKEIYGYNPHIEDYIQPNNIYKKAVLYRAIKILKDRAKSNVQLSFLEYQISKKELREIDKIKNAAEYYMCMENNLPYYYGQKKLCELSFDNVEQFLSFAGEIFERRIAADFSTKRNGKLSISPEEQQKIYLKVANDKWNDILRHFTDGREIQNLLSNIAFLGEITRDRGLASYGGGAYTGIGIKENLLNDIIHRNEYENIIHLLYTCVTANLLKMKSITQGKAGEKHKVFYLNSWICLKYNLPFQQGGWKKLNKKNLLYLLSDPKKLMMRDLQQINYWSDESNDEMD